MARKVKIIHDKYVKHTWHILMPNDQNTTQHPTPEENSIPLSSQEPTADAPIPPMDSEPAEAPSEAPEASREGFSGESNNIPPQNSTPTEAENEPSPEVEQAHYGAGTEEKSRENKPNLEPVTEPIQTPESIKAQISTNEPLNETGVRPVEVEISESQSPQQTETTPPSVPAFVLSQPSHKNMSELLAKEHLAIQNKKRKRLDSIMSLFDKNKNGSTSSPQVTNDEVEKFLHVSDATATRYLSQLEKEGKIKQSGKTGKGVSYSRI